MNQRFGKMVAGGAIASVLLNPTVVLAHHAMGGSLPTNALEGFLSGLAHPVIGLDHLLFVIAAGLLAVAMNRFKKGLIMPIAFILASLFGTGIHLLGLGLPIPELVVSASVVGAGGLLSMRNQPKQGVVTMLLALAGVFHGYAYGEAIVGADVGPVVAYILGFGVIQLAIALSTYAIGNALFGNALFGNASSAQSAVKSMRFSPSFVLRFVGFIICGMGAVLFTTALLDTVGSV